MSSDVCGTWVCFREKEACTAFKAHDSGPRWLQGCLGDGVGVEQGSEPGSLLPLPSIAASQSLDFFIWKMKGIKPTPSVLKTNPNTQRPTPAHNKGLGKGQRREGMDAEWTVLPLATLFPCGVESAENFSQNAIC